MLDLHVLYNATGSTTLSNITAAANIPSNDGQAAAGVPIAPNAILKHWGFMTLIADTLKTIQLVSQDQVDPINGEQLNPGAESTWGIMNVEEYLPFLKAARNLSYAQNTGAAKVAAYTIDQYQAGSQGKNTLGSHAIIPQVFGAGLTAGAWGSQTFSPTAMPPQGKYAILGAYVSGLTNYGVIRFEHADFKGFKPGFPVVDADLAITRAVAPPNDAIFNLYGRQFVAMGDIPTFNITAQGTGLQIDFYDLVADTPNIMLNLAQVVPSAKS